MAHVRAVRAIDVAERDMVETVRNGAASEVHWLGLVTRLASLRFRPHVDWLTYLIARHCQSAEFVSQPEGSRHNVGRHYADLPRLQSGIYIHQRRAGLLRQPGFLRAKPLPGLPRRAQGATR